MKRIHSQTFLVLSVIYIFTLQFKPYPYDFILKVLPIITLIWLCFQRANGVTKKALIVALIASGIGDVMLNLSIDNAFIYGLGAFLSAHIVYTALFYMLRKHRPIKKTAYASIALIIGYAGVMSLYILPDTGGLLIPVALYLIVITCMGIAAIWSSLNRTLILGAALFITSDSVLAISLFKTPLPYSPVLVMITYYLAQYCIVKGVLQEQNIRQD